MPFLLFLVHATSASKHCTGTPVAADQPLISGIIRDDSQQARCSCVGGIHAHAHVVKIVSRLVEALEMYDGRGGGSDSLGMPNDLLDTYASEDVESQLLSNPMKGHRVSSHILPQAATTVGLGWQA